MDPLGLSDVKREALRSGLVIPAHPLALTRERTLDERRQRALTRYYLAAGAGGVAVGVHTTQFAIRDVGLLRPVLELAIETVRGEAGPDSRDVLTVAGVCGDTGQATAEARLAADLGYDLVMPSLGALRDASDDQLLEHCRLLADIRPLFGFYLQPAVGGRHLGYRFWRQLAEIDRLAAIKIAPFDRYRTLDVVRAVVDAGRADEVALYTGNDDNIVLDLLTPYRLTTTSGTTSARIVGGLLGHWAVWTRSAVQLMERVHDVVTAAADAPQDLLGSAVQVTDANAAFFDPVNRFAGSIAGIHEVLRRQGLLAGRWCLDPNEDLSPGQAAEIDRVYAAYPQLNDDRFVTEHLDRWLS
ncbi:MAG: Dihydrodipicolinate synthase family protein RB7999 [uncultured Thermomicrobiales bacterium]|uniref:Dihydrodipicolinate synthase family protein RB7999 n=1 Tax=uncultured Thermomicrobiales bacterium TaxID=1645740 RepID=A0A6J4UW80_9BACT|nr:MAG: Dihydrodipicolinate synthase family protein RB7999 [uncultured Thermomicrobiales bacterium]